MYDRTATAFKHPGCGGVIFLYTWPTRKRFKCERCETWAEDLAELALSPTEAAELEAMEHPANENGPQPR